jgi:hypothetical protein
MNDPRLAEDPDERACQYLETLISDHLKAVMNDYQEQEPPPPQLYDIKTGITMTEILIGALRLDRDVVLALLLQAAVNIKTGPIDQNTMPVDNFLERTINSMMGLGP